MTRPLPLTFGRDSLIALANANGRNYRYEVMHTGKGEWKLHIQSDGPAYTHLQVTRHKTKRDAQASARDHYRRRQIITLV